MFKTIKSKFILNLVLALLSLVIAISLAYSIAVSKVHDIMVNDIKSVAMALEKNMVYISKKNPNAYKEDDFKYEIHSIKVGKTGYVYLISSEGELLIHPKKEGKNLKNTSYGSYIISHKSGGIYEYTSSTTGQKKIAAFRYIPEWDAWIVPGVNKADYFDDLKMDFIVYFSILLASISAVLILLNYLTGSRVLKKIDDITNVAKELSSGDGDLRKRLPSSVNDGELHIMSSNVNEFISKIDTTILDVKSSSAYQTSLSSALTDLTGELRSKTNESDTMSKRTMENLNHIRSSLDGTVKGSEQIFETSKSSEEALAKTTQSINTISSKISLTAESTSEVNEEFTNLITDVGNLKGITAVIRDISDQTNLLALNAAIEAARAGEHGRSFAVVAEEVRALSDRTTKAINEVDASLSVLVQSMSTATEKIEENKSIVDELVDEGEIVKENFVVIDGVIKQNVEISKSSLDSVVEINKDIISIIEQIQYMAALSYENGGFINEVDEIAAEVKSTDNKIDGLLSFFTLSNEIEPKQYERKKVENSDVGDDIFFWLKIKNLK